MPLWGHCVPIWASRCLAFAVRDQDRSGPKTEDCHNSPVVFVRCGPTGAIGLNGADGVYADLTAEHGVSGVSSAGRCGKSVFNKEATMSGNATHGRLRKFVTRTLATGALVALYAFGTAALTGTIMTADVTSAAAAPKKRRAPVRRAPRGRAPVRRAPRGRGRGYWRGGIWFPWLAPYVCHEPWTSRRVWCDLY
jgi:hypothetical protein